jgi:cytochrome bd-type quinol oxidase subunit 2
MKVSKFVTKIVIRVFFILLLVATFLFIQGDQSKFQHLYFSFSHVWEMIFPAIIILCFLFLFITCALKKYNQPEMNWLLVVNTIVLIAYGIAIFIKINRMV